jgi:ribosomal protein S13
MYVLDKSLRNKLENTITKAREIAEKAAKSVIEQLGVDQSTPYTYLTAEQKESRRKLRAHGRQLGDERDQKNEKQDIERLTKEVAYEHWHRMLFARFLAENKLLMFYDVDDIDNAVAVSLEECEEMAQELGCINGWEFAARLAAKMLPQIFRPESPVFELQFSPEKQKELESLLSGLESDVFTASDSLGWVYQFWQSKEKESVNKSEVKIGAKELPAVTQLFTEPYMVNFLLDNSLGAWWSKKRLSENDLMIAVSEDELRNKASLPGVPLAYLRFVKGENGNWSAAGGSFESWPDQLSELKALDPCCGSGHFLVAAFQMLVPMRMKMEGLSAREACDAVLNENIHGLEIDQRCVELAAFAVALTAWKYPNTGGFRRLPDLQIAWCGQSVNVKKEEWLALADNDVNLKMHLDNLYNLFKDATILGSLLNPRTTLESSSIFAQDWKSVSKLMQAKFGKNKNEHDGLGIVAQGIEKAFQLLGDKYHWVLTNVPYRKKADLVPKLQEFIINYHYVGRAALETAFLDRCFEFCNSNGVCSVVIMQNWLQLKSYEDLRKKILKEKTWISSSLLGSGAFETISGEVVKVALMIFTNTVPNTDRLFGFDLSSVVGTEEKSSYLKNGIPKMVKQSIQLMNPDSRISLEKLEQEAFLSKYARSVTGLQTGDNEKYIITFWEMQCIDYPWRKFQRTSDVTKLYSGLNQLLKWEDGKGELIKEPGAVIRGITCIGKKGILIHRMGNLPCTIYLGDLFNQNGAVMLPKKEKDLIPIWCYTTSDDYCNNVRELDKKLGVTPNTLSIVNFDYNYWEKIAEGKYPNGLPKPYSDDPTQWIFHGHPAHSEAPLQVVVSRLLGYRWPAEMDKDMELSDEAKELVKRCDELLPFADEDGIVCIPPVRGEAPASERLLNLLAAAYNGQDINVILSELLASSDHAGKSLDSWLREKFFTQHFKMFGHRPFIWHIWDGLSDGFAALVNYHKLDRKNLETLTYTYLGDWINKQKEEMAAGVDGAEEKLAAAESLKKSLELILEGEEPYDIFVRWKPIHLQPIGWEPDINDGIRMNIRPFMSVPDVGKKGAGILRDKPNIKWDKDRGKDTPTSPWYQHFTGDRINDYHLSLDEKKRAQEEKR